MNQTTFSELFVDNSEWQVFASGEAEGKVGRVRDAEGNAGLRFQYDFHHGSGFVVIRRAIDIILPSSFEIGFQLRGEGGPNHFECKVISTGNDNVWRYLRKDYLIPNEWDRIQLQDRDMPFAWGPAGGGPPSAISAIEFAIVAGSGGKGYVDFSEPYLIDQSIPVDVVIAASSESPQFPATAAYSDDERVWRADEKDSHPWWRVDFGRVQRFGGLIIQWSTQLPTRSFEMDISADGEHWQTLYRTTYSQGLLSHIPLPSAEARYLRLRFANASSAVLRNIQIQSDAFSQSPNEFMHAVARDYPRGWHPRYWHREQSWWTTVGSPEGTRRALINEEGMVEPDEGSFSMEPFILTPDGLLTWAEMKPIAGIVAPGIPMPKVTWKNAELSLDIEPWVDGLGETLTLCVKYRMRFPDAARQGLRLAIAIRPFQVNPPWQSFRNLGGCSPISAISTAGDLLEIQGRSLSCEPPASSMGAAMFEEGGVMTYLAQGMSPPHQQLHDASERASCAFLWDIPEGVSSYEVTVSVPYFQKIHDCSSNTPLLAQQRWQETLGNVVWQVPSCAQGAFDCWRTAAGHILINRDGPAFQPGPRRYTRSWIRDSVIMGAALTKVGLPEPLRDFIEWYSGFQRDDGFVPCVVDRDGIDWLIEHDSHGQFLWGIHEVYRSTHDPEFLRKLMPSAHKAAKYLLKTRSLRTTEFYRSDEQLSRFGLLPESASHEGYLAHPVHSYWDDFWGIRGMQAYAELCANAGLAQEASDWREQAESFQVDVLQSIRRVVSDRHLDYIPGSVEWADFDATATSNAISLLDFSEALPKELLEKTLATYLTEFRRRRDGDIPWINYTAYEIRNMGALVRLGNRDGAHELLRYFLSDRRPIAWNQWPEISWKEARTPGHLGDLPHTWIAAEYILALSSMIACERIACKSLALATGMPWQWIAEESGFAVFDLPTYYGALQMKLRATSAETIFVEVGGSLRIPPGGLTLHPPCPVAKIICSIHLLEGNAEMDPNKTGCFQIRKLPLRATLQIGEKMNAAGYSNTINS